MKSDDMFRVVFEVRWLQVWAALVLLLSVQIVVGSWLKKRSDVLRSEKRAHAGSPYLLLCLLAAATAATAIVVVMRDQIIDREISSLRSELLYVKALMREQSMQRYGGPRPNK